VRVVPVGVDENVFELGPRAGRRRDQVLFVGLINFNKGIDLLLHAMARLVARGTQARLLLAGGAFYRNTRRQSDQIRPLVSTLGLERSVEFLGVQPPNEVARLMRESTVLVLPSRAESFGAVLVEALASGTPVVATRCGGPEDIVTDDVGLLVPSEDPDSLADALANVLRNQDRYVPEALRADALARFSLPEVAARTMDQYLEVLGGEAPAAAPPERLRSAARG
jgi:glycosyltransferase involved in cell wall biosynthesis